MFGRFYIYMYHLQYYTKTKKQRDQLTLPAKFLTIETCCVRRTEVVAARMANLEAEENIMVYPKKRKNYCVCVCVLCEQYRNK